MTDRSRSLPRARPTGAAPFAALVALVAAAAAGSLAVGDAPVPLRAVPGALLGLADPASVLIVRDLRAPRLALALAVGAALGATGACYQALFRNPLADPFVVGSSSGAAVGVALAVVLNLATPTIGAFVGAVLAVLVVAAVALSGRLPPAGLLLAGVAVSTILGALVWLVVALAEHQTQSVIGWLMGGLAGKGWPDARTAVPLVVVGVSLLTLLGRPLDAVAAGDDVARSLGLPLGAFAALVLTIASVLVAAAVAAGGVIGFVGLVAPHAARPLVGGAHARLVPASALVAAFVVVVADVAARALLAPVELPLGVVTSLVGGPFFLVILRRAAAGRR